MRNQGACPTWAFLLLSVLFLSVISAGLPVYGPHTPETPPMPEAEPTPNETIEPVLETAPSPNETQPMPEPEAEPFADEVVGPIFMVLPEEVVVNANDMFVISIYAENLIDMYGWQIHLSFDSSIVECVNVSVPDNHVFSERYPVSQALIDWNSTEFTERPIQHISVDAINNGGGYVLACDCLLGSNQTTFSGSGFLCQIAFKAISVGSSALSLSLSGAFTIYYLESNLECITPTVSNSEVVVLP